MLDHNTLHYKSLTAETWEDFERLFGEKGTCGGCWCMLWRLKRSTFEKQKGEQNKKAMHDLVLSGKEPGILIYIDDKAIGWCALSERENYPALERSRILKKVDEQKVWSISCFFIEKSFRRKGVSAFLLKFAIDFCQSKGGTILEGYPVEPKKDRMPAVFAWTGIASAYLKAGFKEVARRSETRPVMRYYIQGSNLLNLDSI